MGFTPGLGRCLAMPHGRRAWQSTNVFSPGESHGQWSLIGYSLCSHKEDSQHSQDLVTYTLPFIQVWVPQQSLLSLPWALRLHCTLLPATLLQRDYIFFSDMFSCLWASADSFFQPQTLIFPPLHQANTCHPSGLHVDTPSSRKFSLMAKLTWLTCQMLFNFHAPCPQHSVLNLYFEMCCVIDICR